MTTFRMVIVITKNTIKDAMTLGQNIYGVLEKKLKQSGQLLTSMSKAIRVGDLVALDLKNNTPTPGALTAVKFYARLEKEIGSAIGIVLSAFPGSESVYIQFPHTKKVIHRKFVKLVTPKQ